MSKLGFMQDLIRGIKKILGRDKKPAAPTVERVVVQGDSHAQDAAPLLRRAFLFLEDGEFDNADEYAEKVLDINPECAEAYIVKLLIELRLKKPSDLAQCKNPISDSHNYQKALRFATPEYRETIEGYNNAIIKRIDTARKDEVYARGVELMRLHRYDEAVQYFQKIPTYKDSTQKIDDCKKLKETERRDGIYERATQLLNAGQFDEAARLFESIEDHKDSKEKIKLCGERKETARKDAIYSQAMNRVRPQNADDAAIKKSIEELQTISGYRDVDDQIRALNTRLEKWYEDKKKAEEAARIKAEEDRRTREREEELRRIKAEKTKKTVKKVAKIGIPSVVALATLLILLFTLVIPLIRYNKADELFNAGKYDEAMEIYQDIGGFSDSEQRITVLTGIEKIDDAAFEEGIEKILSAGVPVKLTYGMGGGDFSGTTYLSAPQEENNNGIVLLSASTTPNITPLATTTASVPETVEYTYNSSADFSGIQTPGRSGYRFVKWELETYNYQIGGTFEMKLNAVWSEKEYTIEYDLNDGKVTTNNPVEYGIEDDSFTLINPTKTGYTFIGWTGTGLDGLTMSVTIEKGSVGDRSYEANWQANTYTITLNPNGGSIANTTITVTYDQAYTLNDPEWTGHTFGGWYEGSKKVTSGTWTRTSDLELTAKWDIVEYDITYNLNSGTNSSSNPATYTVDDEVILVAPTRTGYTFAGWTYAGQTTPVLSVTIPVGTIGDKEYTANWTADSYTLSFDADGGSVSPESKTVTYDASFTLPTPTKSGYTFAGWFSGTKQYTAGTWKDTSNITLKAHWTANTYTVTYDDTSETRANVIVTFNYNYSGSTSSTVTLTNGQTLSYPNIPTRSGYVFAGWYTNSSCSSKYNFSGTITQDTTLYAKWISNAKSNVINVGASTSVSLSGTTIKYYAFVPLVSGNITVYSSSSYDTYGYLYNSSLSQLTYNDDGGSNSNFSYTYSVTAGTLYYIGIKAYSSSTSGTATLYITGTQKPTSTATASCGTTTGYVYDTSSTASTTVTFGSSHTLPALTRTGYSFLGWYNGNTKVESGNWSIASNVTLTPKWQAGGNTITLDANGGTVTPNSIPVSYDQAYTLPTPTWTGHTFAGWYYNGTQYSSGTWTGLSDITLTARWTTNDYSITFDDITEINTTATITYNYNYSGSTSSTVTLTNGQTLNRPTNPTRSGYVFTGWYTNSSCTTRYDFTGTITGNMTLYAGWEDMSMSYVYTETQINPTDYTSSSDYYSISTSYTSSSSKKHIYLVAEETGTHYIYWKNYYSYSYYGYYLQIYNLTTGTTIRSSSNTYSTSYQSSSFTCSKGDVIVISLYRYNTSYSSNAYFYFSGFGSPATSTAKASLPTGGLEYKNNSTYIDSVDYGSTYTLPTPTRTGYTFGGWYNGSTKVESGAWNYASNVTLTAKWTANTYTLTFNANGGSVSPTSQTVTYDSTYTLPTPTWAGHTFSGWYNGSTKITSGTWKTTSNMTLTAKWDSVDYTISYTLNGGTNNSSNPSTYTVNDSFTLMAPTKAGYTFLGWTYSGQTTPTKTVTIAEGTMGNLSYTANWQVNTYTVTFDANGGSVSPTSKTVTYDASYTVPTPTRTGYTFAGWYNGSTQYSGGTWKTASNITLTAKWTANSGITYVVNHYKQNIYDDGYTIDSSATQNLTGTADASVTPAVKTYTGFTSPSARTVTIKPDGSLVVDYYYTRNSYTITMVTNGGESITTIRQKYQSALTMPTAEREGYTFGGWYTDKTLTTAFTNTTITTSNITVYAHWSEENKPGDFTYSGTSAITVSAYSGTSTTMWIPAYIGGVPVTTIPASAFANQTTLTKVVIPETVTAIGEGALKGCSALEDLTIPFVGSSASANQTNDAVLGYIFGRYTSSASSKPTGTVYQGWSYKNDSYLITSTSGYNYSYSTSYRADYYYIPTTIKSLTITQDTTIPYGAFQNCDFIEAIVIPNTTTSIGAFAFKNCKGITEVNLGTALESIGRYAFDGCISLGKVTMPNSVTTIGTYTFNGCVALTKINSTTEGVAILPTSLTSIPAYAFQNCSGITNISVTNITSVGTYAFNGCNYITRINGIKDGELILPNGLTTIGAYAFQNLAEITKIVVPNTVTEIGIGAFKGCISLADITLPFIGKTAESSQSNEAVFGHIFGMYGSATSSKPTGTVYQGWSYKNDSYLITGTYGNNYSNSSSYRADYYYIPTTIKNVTITVDTTIPYGAFQNCDFIESISILSTTTSIDAFAFRNCKGLTTMNLGTTLTSIGRYAFSGCISLESISMPNTVSSIGSHAFDGCITLKKMNSSTEGTISLPTSLTSISSYIFQGCTEITKVVVGDITSIGTYAFSGCENITQFNSNTDGQLIIPSGVTTIGEYAFQNLSSITKIVVPDTVTEIGNGAFKGCSALEDITIPFIGKTVDSSASAEAAFGYIFGKYASEWSSTSSKPTGTIYQGWECYSSSYLTSGTMGRNYSYKSYYRADYYYIPTTIKSVTITQDTTIPYGAFHNCDFIESITLPTTITSVGSYAFMNCDGLTAMSLGTKLTSIGTNAFEGCINLATISIPNTVESIGSYAFNGCVALKRMNSTTDGVISLPASVTAISSYAFQGCTSITKMVVGDIASIGAYALSGCENITQFNSNTNGELIIPSGVKTIGEYAFQNLASITKVVVPDTVTEIGEGAFKGCNAIEDITLPFIGKTATASGSSDALFGYIFGRYASSASTTPTGTVYQGWGTYSSSYPTSGTSGKNYHQSSYYYAHYYYIPSTIKNVTITVDTTIPYGAFQNCSFIETIVLPTTVTSVGNYAYQNCSATVSQTYETKTDMSWDGTTVATDFGSGDGTQANPYIISTGAELALLSQKVNDGETFAGVYFKLAKNISLNGKTFTTIGSKNNKFEGIFDGNGCVISNFKISTSESYAGLFGYVSGTIQNLGVQGTVSVSGTSANAYVGMIAGYNTGTIQNCFATGSVTLSSANTTHAGGLVGYNEGNIINSYATTNVTSTSTGYMAYAGGLVGYAKSGTISGSYAAGDVKAQGTSSDYSRNGGLVGFLNSDATVANCYRSELQLLTRYTTAGASYCEEGTSASIETIKAYVSANWSSVIWSFNNTHPRFVEN